MDKVTRDGDQVYMEAGEGQERTKLFCVDDIARAFHIERSRVLRALDGEFGLQEDCRIDSKMSQQLAEVLLGHLPLDRRLAALMELGAFTPRSDAAWGAGSGPPDEESDRQNATAGVPDDERASERSSFDPATQSAE